MFGSTELPELVNGPGAAAEGLDAKDGLDGQVRSEAECPTVLGDYAVTATATPASATAGTAADRCTSTS